MPDKIKQQADELIRSPEGRAFLQMIQASEGGRYNVASVIRLLVPTASTLIFLQSFRL